jgi:hypothetical protein
MAKNKRIDEHPLGSLRIGDFLIFRDMTEGVTKKVLADQFLTSDDDQNFQWVPNANDGDGYATDEFVTYGGKWWQSLVDSNLSVPGTDGTKWSEGSKVYGTLRVWKAGLYTNAEEYVVGYNAQSHLFLYRLATSVTRPFNSTDFLTEIAAGQWEPASKSYIDAIADGDIWKFWAHAATIGNITLSGTQTVDGRALVVGNICLVIANTDRKENGWWQVKSGAWARCSFADAGYKLTGAIGYVSGGNVNSKRVFVQVTEAPVVGTNDILFEDITNNKKLKSVDTSGSNPDLDFLGFLNNIFVASTNIAASKTWGLLNVGNKDHFVLRLNMTTLDDQTFPSTFKMAVLEFNSSTHKWTPPSTGYFEFIGDYDGTNWWIKVSGPY